MNIVRPREYMCSLDERNKIVLLLASFDWINQRAACAAELESLTQLLVRRVYFHARRKIMPRRRQPCVFLFSHLSYFYIMCTINNIVCVESGGDLCGERNKRNQKQIDTTVFYFSRQMNCPAYSYWRVCVCVCVDERSFRIFVVIGAWRLVFWYSDRTFNGSQHFGNNILVVFLWEIQNLKISFEAVLLVLLSSSLIDFIRIHPQVNSVDMCMCIARSLEHQHTMPARCSNILTLWIKHAPKINP